MHAFVSTHMAEAEQLLETLSQIPSPSNKEEKRISFIASWFREKGGEVTVDEVGNVLCRLGHHDNGFVVFSAHIDIVDGSMEPLPLVKDGNIWRCPGIGDDTANVVNMMMAYLYAKEHEEEFSSDLLFVADVGEEALGNLKGVRHL
ncbi:MAG: M28 family peptidase, partial [Spirochaetales bacterium]|nr:M28 family peptidase [Candidatus Physcosoma equi]